MGMPVTRTHMNKKRKNYLESKMDQNIINWIIAILGGLAGFVLKAVWDGVKDLQAADKCLMDKVASIEVLIAGDYLRRDEFNTLSNIIFLKLDKIMDKLDAKADK